MMGEQNERYCSKNCSNLSSAVYMSVKHELIFTCALYGPLRYEVDHVLRHKDCGCDPNTLIARNKRQLEKLGEFIRKARLNKRVCFREFCLKNNLDVVEHSRIERGLIPVDHRMAIRIMNALLNIDAQKMNKFLKLWRKADLKKE